MGWIGGKESSNGKRLALYTHGGYRYSKARQDCGDHQENKTSVGQEVHCFQKNRNPLLPGLSVDFLLDTYDTTTVMSSIFPP